MKNSILPNRLLKTKIKGGNMALTDKEKSVLQEALQVYLQLISRQLPGEQVQAVAQVAESIMSKLDSIGNNGSTNNKPMGISDEWYENVCQKCDKLSPNGCSDKVTEKFPGKCDPILHYENKKNGLIK